MNTSDYLRQDIQLQDDKLYTKISHDKTLRVEEKIQGILKEMRQRGFISDKNLEHLSLQKAMKGRFYMFPNYTKKMYQADQFVVLWMPT